MGGMKCGCEERWVCKMVGIFEEEWGNWADSEMERFLAMFGRRNRGNCEWCYSLE
jgi:hypothetical protein